MWHFKDGDFEVHGTRQELKEQLNIFMVGFWEMTIRKVVPVLFHFVF